MARVESTFNLDGKLIPSLKLVDTNSEKVFPISVKPELLLTNEFCSRTLILPLSLFDWSWQLTLPNLNF